MEMAYNEYINEYYAKIGESGSGWMVRAHRVACLVLDS